MSFEVVWEPAAVDLCSRFLSDDAEGLRALFDAVDTLADQPRPAEAFLSEHRGSTACASAARVVYEIDDIAEVVKVRHVGRRT